MCIFCQIVAWEIPSIKIRENDDFLAILDIFPNTKGMTLVMPKKHYDSNILEMEDPEFFSKYMLATKQVSQLLKKWLNVNRVGLVIEWMWVNHAHIKLYPMHGLSAQREEQISWEPVFFEKYPWFLSSASWPKANIQELEAIAQQIKNP